MIVVATSLQPRSPAALARTLAWTGEVLTALRRSSGLLAGSLRVDVHGIAWTVTVWQDGASLAAFRGAHQDVASRLPRIVVDPAADSVITAWQASSPRVPSWREVADHLPAVPAPVSGIDFPVAPARPSSDPLPTRRFARVTSGERDTLRPTLDARPLGPAERNQGA